MSYQKVLVHVTRNGDKVASKAHFTQSILDVFGETGDEIYLYTSLEADKLHLSQVPLQENDQKIKMKRPSFCPIHLMTSDQKGQLPNEISERGIDCGAVTLLESCDGKILLTRRANHLRTFPGIWVPPGGHIEVNETLLEAALRELYEETGLKISKEWCENEKISKLALWESAFPPKLSGGLPKRHHAVVYLHAKLIPPYSSDKLQQDLKLDPEEVGASTWLDRNMIEGIVKTIQYEESGNMSDDEKCQIQAGQTSTFRATVISKEDGAVIKNLKTEVLLSVATGENVDCERVSTGTKFALSEWLHHCTAKL